MNLSIQLKWLDWDRQLLDFCCKVDIFKKKPRSKELVGIGWQNQIHPWRRGLTESQNSGLSLECRTTARQRRAQKLGKLRYRNRHRNRSGITPCFLAVHGVCRKPFKVQREANNTQVYRRMELNAICRRTSVTDGEILRGRSQEDKWGQIIKFDSALFPWTSLKVLIRTQSFQRKLWREKVRTYTLFEQFTRLCRSSAES